MNNTLNHVWSKFLIKSISLPIIFLAMVYTVYLSYEILLPIYFNMYAKYFIAYNSLIKLSYNVAAVIGMYWFLRNIMTASSVILIRWATEKKHPLVSMICSATISSLKGICLLIMVNIIILMLDIHGTLGLILDKAEKIFLICLVASIVYKIVSRLEEYIVSVYIEENPDIQNSRKLRTQVILLKKIIIFMIFAFSLIAVTMLFDSIKAFGISMLTTAGIVSAVAAFASQQSLARLFAGLQLAFTQPLRIGDTVVIDNEFGQVEEISLSFITIKLWDLRRLIVPTDYFTNKGLVNLTAESSELLGTVFFYTDYNLPIDEIRQEFLNILSQSPYWNKKSSSLDITDFKDNAMEFRCLVSADDASNLWKLRCEVREKLINHIVKFYPQCLTKSRSLAMTPQMIAAVEPAQ